MTKKTHLLVSILITLSTSLFSQVITDKTFFDFGEVNKEDKKYVDFKLTNASDASVKILKYETPYGISVRVSQKVLKQDESALIRIKYTPKRKGEFKSDVQIYVSSNNQPIILTVTGKALTFNVNESLEVPDFEQVQEKNAGKTFDLNIKVVKQADGSPVENAKLDIIWNGVMYKSLNTSSNGLVKNDFVPDNYYIVVNADELGSFESELNIHENIKEFIIELGPEGTLSQVTEDSAETYETEIVAVVPEPVIPITEIEEDDDDENPSFSDKEYKANNIVFLIDVSVSMKQKGKLNLLKASMIELTDLLRSVDKVAIVTYSSKAELALKSTSASNKSEIKNVIQNLEARGSTAGAKGMKKAYQVLASNEIEGGNNQIFISTDGAFNLDRQDKGLVDLASKNAKKGYKISVVGIKNQKVAVKNMKLLAEAGNGNYIHINTYKDAQTKLVDEVKIQSRTSDK